MNTKPDSMTQARVWLQRASLRLAGSISCVCLLCLSLFLAGTPAWAQQSVTGRVVDDRTGEPVPYATVYVSQSNGTLTNEEGRFQLTLEPADSVTVSFLGYTKRRFLARDLPRVVRLESAATQMREVTVVSPASILNKVVKRLDKEYRTREGKSADYFLRQTFELKSGRSEMVEAFMTSDCAVNLRHTAFISGRHYQLADYSELAALFSSSNLQHLFDFAPRVYDNPFWDQVYVPLGSSHPAYLQVSQHMPISGTVTLGDAPSRSDTRKLVSSSYDIRVEELPGDDGYYKIHFTRRERMVNHPLVTGTLYVQSKGFRVLGFEGRMSGVVLDAAKDFWLQTSETEPVIRIGYTHRRGFTEVEYVSCVMEAAQMKCRSIAYNLGARELKATRRQKVELGDDMLHTIAQAGYDPALWEQTLIQRTAHEERIAGRQAAAGDSLQAQAVPGAAPRHLQPDSLALSGPFRPLVERLRAFGRTIPQEKIFVHMDNTSYQLGDTIWFSAYTRRTDTDRPSGVSGVLYAELYNQDGYLVERKLVQMTQGEGSGYFALADKAPYAGFYELRAYTRWQLNWGGYEREHSPFAIRWFDSREFEKAYFRDYEKLYSRVFPVYDRPQEPGVFTRDMTLRGKRRYFRKDMDRRTLTLSVFPEGGGLVAGLPCRVAFEAAWSDGEWTDGWLYCGQDSVRVQNRGRGTFTVTPVAGKAQKVRFVAADGSVAECRLPDADPQGVALHLQQQGAGWRAAIRTSSQLPADSLALTLMHEGRLISFQPLARLAGEAGERVATFDASALSSSGVFQLTVFDSHGHVYADRLFFVRRDRDLQPSLTMQGLKETYAPYEPVSLKLKAPQGARSVSLAVRDDSRRDFLNDNGTILTEMLLASEIRGFVPQPGWYFERNDEEHRTGLDLLMLTQGWRRFRWQDMAISGTWDLSQPAEQAPVIRGGVYKYNWDYLGDGESVLHPDLSALLAGGNHSTQPAEPSVVGGATDRKAVDPAAIRPDGQSSGTDGQAGGQKEDRSAGRDRDYIMSRQYLKSDKDVKLHAELVSADGQKMAANERVTKNGRFQMQLPPFYGQAHFFLSAADTTKWSRRERKNYKWVQGKEYDVDFDPRSPINKFKKIRFDIKRADYKARVQWPYPRFVSGYSHYQSTLSQRPERDSAGSLFVLDAGDVHNMPEISVRAKHNGMRAFDDSQPCVSYDAEEADNMVFDAGMFSLARYVVADYGLVHPFVGGMNNLAAMGDGMGDPEHMEVRYGISPSRRALPQYIDRYGSIPRDSLYRSDRLLSFMSLHSPEEAREFYRGIDRLFIYTDYDRRKAGDRRYQGTDLPVTTTVMYPRDENDLRVEYRDRHYVLQGFAYPAEFYSPDYSKRQLTDMPADYRRTLYWNPHLTLDQQGEATVTFYNCGRTTEPSASAQGQSPDGTLLWSE